MNAGIISIKQKRKIEMRQKWNSCSAVHYASYFVLHNVASLNEDNIILLLCKSYIAFLRQSYWISFWNMQCANWNLGNKAAKPQWLNVYLNTMQAKCIYDKNKSESFALLCFTFLEDLIIFLSYSNSSLKWKCVRKTDLFLVYCNKLIWFFRYAERFISEKIPIFSL